MFVYTIQIQPVLKPGCTTGLTTVLNEQPLLVQHGCQTAFYSRFNNRLYTRYSWLSNRFDNRLYRVNGALYYILYYITQLFNIAFI